MESFKKKLSTSSLLFIFTKSCRKSSIYSSD